MVLPLALLAIGASVVAIILALRLSPSPVRQETLFGAIGTLHLGVGVVVYVLMPEGGIGRAIEWLFLVVAVAFFAGAVRIARHTRSDRE